MNLLLLLSALLSALTGVNASTRAPQATTELTATSARPAVMVAVSRVSRPAATLPVLRKLAEAPRHDAWLLAAAEPIFASRRRE